MNNFVYICCYQSNDKKENRRRGKLYKQYVIDEGYYPVAPYMDFSWREAMDKKEKALRDNVDMDALEQCSQIWVFGDIIDEDMQDKINRAEELSIAIEYIADWECAVG